MPRAAAWSYCTVVSRRRACPGRHAAPTVAVTALATAVAATAGAAAWPGRGGGAHRAAVDRLVQRPRRPRPRPGGRPHGQAAGHRRGPAAARSPSPAPLAVAACVPLSLASGWRAGLAHLVGVAGGWAYDLGLKRTVLVLAAVRRELRAARRLPHARAARAPGAAVAGCWPAGALLGTGAHFLNVVPDVDARPGGRRPRAAPAARRRPARTGRRRTARRWPRRSSRSVRRTPRPGPVPGWPLAVGWPWPPRRPGVARGSRLPVPAGDGHRGGHRRAADRARRRPRLIRGADPRG